MGRHRAPLDGLRAVAIAAVIFYHWAPGSLPGGFLGVDIFFVLSGYLITNALLAGLRRDTAWSFASFWGRRARRVLPPLFVMLAGVAVWAAFAVPSDQLGAVRADSLWTLAGAANWHAIVSGQSYFDLFSEPSPLRHTWFSSVIEQYYLLWPLLLIGVVRLVGGRMRLVVMFCAIGTIASAALLAATYDPADPSRAYFGSDTRASQFLVGGILAVLLLAWSPTTRKGRVGLQTAGALAAAVSAVAFFVAEDDASWLYHGGFLVFAVVTGVLVAALVQPTGGALHRPLSVRPVVWIGTVSFGLYLWHWPVGIAISEARTDLTGWGLTLVRVLVTLALATASYYLVELPVLRQKRRGRRAWIAAPAAAALVAGVVIVSTAGATPSSGVFADPGNVITHGPRSTATTSTTVIPDGVPQPESSVPTRFLLVGDSIGQSLSAALSKEADARGQALYGITRAGCGMTTTVPSDAEGISVPWASDCARETAQYQSDAVRDAQPEVVLWLSSWETSDHVVDGRVLRFGTRRGDAALLDDFEASRDRLTADGAMLVMLTMPPTAERSDLGPADQEAVERFVHLNDLLRDFASRNPDTVKVLDLAGIVCPGGPPCPEVVDGVRIRPRDGGHFSPAGADWVAPRLLDALTGPLGSSGA
ncbi:MAG: acyltransferase family protein [Acidimicrobiia bacterium]